ncbi:Thioredoxin reductase [Actinacidiphila yanglinensis]|uniref:Thioredoxin reductase n=1 Tax=Actinacidiphila yanglinensis TaxID=310779 RepID=A0A1H6DAG6_9ACTN|nr:FAD-dependent oxidoreductase [Actinacidiphila yanglinensis]SEG82182.1 Thioredoxin reductase [Actinacidiphila yanglinensis]
MTDGTPNLERGAVLTPDVLVVGAGPAGLTAAARLAGRTGADVLVLDRADTPGGVPVHTAHTGFGLRDLHRVLSGPAYAARLAGAARAAGADLRGRAMVTGWSGPRQVEATTPDGLLRVRARAVLLATGARERPRPARLVPGDRPQGVLTTGQLQQLVHGSGRHVGERAVVVGAEPVSWSAVLTLRAAGCRTVLMTSRYDRAESYAAFTVPGRTVLGVPVATGTRVVRIIGRGRVEGVEIEHAATGRRRTVACDTVVFTGDWVPEHELARAAGLAIDPGTLGPVVDTALHTSEPGVFAAGNLLHPVDTADGAALDGRHAADRIAAWLAAPGGEGPPLGPGVPVVAGEPFRWVAPQLLRPGGPAPPRGRLLLWSDALVRVPRVRVCQDGRVLARRRLPWPAAPGRVFRVPFALLSRLDPSGGPVRLALE